MVSYTVTSGVVWVLPLNFSALSLLGNAFLYYVELSGNNFGSKNNQGDLYTNSQLYGFTNLFFSDYVSEKTTTNIFFF